MRDYILGDKIISVTPEKYESVFKGLGYLPYVKEEKAKVVETTEKKTKNKNTFETEKDEKVTD